MNGGFHVAREPGVKGDSWFYHVEDGWYYHLNAERNGTKYFKCVRYERGCRGRAILDPVEGFNHSNPHNEHEQDPHYPDEQALRRSILERCRNLEYLSFHQILGEESLLYNRTVRSRVTLTRMRTAMRNARMSRFPAMPVNLRGLTRILTDPVHRVLSLTTDGEDNLYAGSATDLNGGHHTLFASGRMLELMRTFRLLHCDGTFKVVPAGTQAEQVLAIVGVWNNHIIPLAWALMQNRTQVAYTAVLQLLSHLLGDERELTRVITDFEEAEMNSWEEVFGVRVQGCMWHLCRRFLIAAGELGLVGFMRNIPAVKRIVRLTMALPLLPQNHRLSDSEALAVFGRCGNRLVVRLSVCLFVCTYSPVFLRNYNTDCHQIPH